MRRGDPVPEDDDLQGVGVVDFGEDRVWLRYRGWTPRMAAEVAGRHRLLAGFSHRQAARKREIYFHGMARWRRKRGGTWSAPRELPEWRATEHPLWLFGPL